MQNCSNLLKNKQIPSKPYGIYAELMSQRRIKVNFDGKTTTVTVQEYICQCAELYIREHSHELGSDTLTGVLNGLLEDQKLSVDEATLSELSSFLLLSLIVKSEYDASGKVV